MNLRTLFTLVFLCFPMCSLTFGDEKTEATQESQFPLLPEMMTSFGGYIDNGALYTYGGHTGSAHSYSTEEQGNVLRRLKLNGKSEWEPLMEGPHLQGLALVVVDGAVYRLGGFTAKNAKGEEHDLWSQNTVAKFDPSQKGWQELPPLPEPRSSFDAAVLDGVIYVVGGWQLRGDQDSIWHQTAWKLDPSQKKPKWEALPKPPFVRRALSVAAHDGKIFAVGGMKKEGKPTTQVDVLDLKTGKWSKAGELEGEGITGFGSAAFALGGSLYASTIKGNLQKYDADTNDWEIVKETPTARFFHRMLPFDSERFLIVGGANMGIGKFDQIEILDAKAPKKKPAE